MRSVQSVVCFVFVLLPSTATRAVCSKLKSSYSLTWHIAIIEKHISPVAAPSAHYRKDGSAASPPKGPDLPTGCWKKESFCSLLFDRPLSPVATAEMSSQLSSSATRGKSGRQRRCSWRVRQMEVYSSSA